MVLINADTSTPIRALVDGETISLSALPTKNLNIQAVTVPIKTGSVKFAYDANLNFQTENISPYAMFGDANGNYNIWTPTIGIHTATATPFSGSNASGQPGTPKTAKFTVVA